MTKGKAYYLEAVMKEGKGDDHLSVGVKLPGKTRIKSISKEDVYLRPPGKKTLRKNTHLPKSKGIQKNTILLFG